MGRKKKQSLTEEATNLIEDNEDNISEDISENTDDSEATKKKAKKERKKKEDEIPEVIDIDNTHIIMTEIAPLVEQIKKICAINKIPFFFSVLATNSNLKTKYISEILSPAVAEKELKDDRITPMLNVANGFDTVHPMFESYFDF